MFAKSTHTSFKMVHVLSVMTLFFIVQIIASDLAYQFTLIPDKVVQGNEWWRVLTHVFAIDSPWLAFLGLPIYYWLGKETEHLTQDGVFPIGFLIGAIITGLVYAVMPVECPPLGAGLYGMLYSASLAMTIVRSPAISVPALAKLRISIISTLTIGFGFVFLGMSMFIGDMMYMYSYSLQSGSGIMIGLLTGLIWSHIRLAGKETEVPKHDFPTYVPIATQPIRKDERTLINIMVEQREVIQESHLIEEDPDDETILNVILEKIHDQQFDSLTEGEKAFLERYSRSLK